MTARDSIPDDPPEKVEEIFDKCVRVFLLKGYKSCTMDDIAQAAGCEPDWLKERYPTKPELTAAALRWYHIKYSSNIRSELAIHQDIYAAMEAALFAFIDICFDQLETGRGLFVRTFIDISNVDDTVLQAYQELQDGWEAQILEKFSLCRSELKNPEDAEILACYVITVIEGLYELVKLGKSREVMYKVAILSLNVIESKLKYGQPDRHSG